MEKSPQKKAEPRRPFERFLAFVEWLGNLLPHPVSLFALFALSVAVVSAIAAAMGLQVEDPRPGSQGQLLTVSSLLTGEGIRWIGQNLVKNFTGFVPLGTVLVAMLGVSVAEKSGLLTTAVRALVLGAPKNQVTFIVVFAGVLSNTASEMGYVVLIPLSMAIFHSLGRHPLAGMAAVPKMRGTFLSLHPPRGLFFARFEPVLPLVAHITVVSETSSRAGVVVPVDERH